MMKRIQIVNILTVNNRVLFLLDIPVCNVIKNNEHKKSSRIFMFLDFQYLQIMSLIENI